MELTLFNPTPCGFPKPRVPLLPDRAELLPLSKWCSESSPHSTASHFRHFTRGRYALGEAYRLSGVDKDSALLAPAYHCVTMLDPALTLGADVQLYPLQPDLSPDLEKLDALLATTKKPAKALLATHFFGFAQDFTCLKQWCDQHDIVLIEDCSHVLFTENFQAPGTGIFGKFVAASPYKFFACENGGLLHSSAEHLLDSITTKSAGLMQELRGIKHTIEKHRSTNALVSEITRLDEQVQALSTTPLITADEQIVPYSHPSSMYSAAEAKTAALRSSRFIVRHASIKKNVAHRQNNYQRWAKETATLPNCRPLFPDLPTNGAPYMFPLHIDHPSPHFYWLKHLGVPVWRWDEMAISNCPVAQDYRLHLLHLPCHQSLSIDQMDWMIAALQKTLRRSAQGTQ